MTQKTAAEALAAYDELYKNPRTGEHIIDGDEAQVAAGLESRKAAQQWIADNDPAARRMFHIEAEETTRGDDPMSRARRLYRKALKLQQRADRHFKAAEKTYRKSRRHAERGQHFEDLADRYEDLSREARR